MSNSAETTVGDRARSQLNVRIPREHYLLAKRSAAFDDLNMTDYIDQLIMRDVKEKRERFKADHSAWKKQARLDAEAKAEAMEAALAELDAD